MQNTRLKCNSNNLNAFLFIFNCSNSPRVLDLF